MTFFKVTPAVFGVALLAAAFSPSAKADEYNQKTIVTFSEPVEIPPVYITGMRVLPAGTYVFKLVNSVRSMRVSKESELEGLDMPEFGGLAYPEDALAPNTAGA